MTDHQESPYGSKATPLLLSAPSSSLVFHSKRIISSLCVIPIFCLICERIQLFPCAAAVLIEQMNAVFGTMPHLVEPPSDPSYITYRQ